MMVRLSPSGEEVGVEPGEKLISLAPSVSQLIGWETVDGDYVQSSTASAGELLIPLATFSGVTVPECRAVVLFGSSNEEAAETLLSISLQRQPYTVDGLGSWADLAVSSSYAHSPLLVEVPLVITNPISVGTANERYRFRITGETGSNSRVARIIDIITRTISP